MRRRFVTLDVFTERAFGGNPLAVLPDGSGIGAARMQQIAREFNLSETVFVLPPDDPAHTRRVRIFTPSAEVPFAGHPTLGTAFALAACGEIELTGERTEIVLEEGVGPVPVRIESRAGAPRRTRLTTAGPPELGPGAPDAAAVARCLGLAADDVVVEAGGLRAASCGIPFLFVELRDRAALGRARLDTGEWERGLAHGWAPDVYLYTRDVESPGIDLRARMFAPAHGVTEDPATGSAVAALAALLPPPASDGEASFRIEQGVEMGRPSLLELEADWRGGELLAVRVGGTSVLVSEGEIEVAP